MADKQHIMIDDDTWLNLLNGSSKAVPDNIEQKKVVKLREIILRQYAEENNYSSNDNIDLKKQEARYAEERSRLLKKLKEKNLIKSKSIPDTPKENIIDKFFSFISFKNNFISSNSQVSLNKSYIIPIIFISFLAISITPLLISFSFFKNKDKTRSPFAEIMQRGNESFPSVMEGSGSIISFKDMKSKDIDSRSLPPLIKQVESPHKYTSSFQKELIAAGLDVNVKKEDNGWLLETTLPMPLTDHKDIIIILNTYLDKNDVILGEHMSILFKIK